MITMDILQEFSGSNDQIIIKRKRTKRPRPSSSTSSSGVCVFAAAAGGGGRGEEFHNSVSISSPASSTGLSTTTEEEEDMAANCLILLARGGRVEGEIKSAEKKNGSRKLTKMATTTIGKVGIYVYECKTCSRAFSSFQALGGHRTSHKRPKPTSDTVDREKSPPEEEECVRFNSESTFTPALAQPSNKIRHHENKAAKIHECAICGSEFGSGQALGGHMRRHRSVVSTNNNLKIGMISIDAETSSNDASQKAANMLALDLNMPAETEEDDRSEEKFHSPDRQPRFVFSAAALVDCHLTIFD